MGSEAFQGSLSGIHIKVSTEVLCDKAQLVSKHIRNMQNTFEQMEQIVNRTNYYWIGEAGDLHRQSYNRQKETIEIMLKRLKEHPVDLLTISENYEMAEQMAENITAELPGDVIE